METKWTSFDNELSMQQGWLVVHAHMADYDGLQIEKFDENTNFLSDFEAVAYVADRAMRGDYLANKAIEYIRENGGRLY